MDSGLDIKDFPCLFQKSPLNTKLVLENNLLVLIKNSIFIANIYVFHPCLRTSPLCTLLVPVQFLLILDKRMVLNVKMPL